MRRIVTTIVVSVVLLGALAAGASPAFASGVWWGLTSGSRPSDLPPAGAGEVVVTAQDRGVESAHATPAAPVVVRDTLPAGLTATAAEGIAGDPPGYSGNRGPVVCSVVSARVVECRFQEGQKPHEEGVLLAFEQIEVRISVQVGSARSGEENTVSVTGGGAEGDSTVSRPINVGASTSFGLEEDYELAPEEEGGAPSTQAGVHPFQLTNVLALNTSVLASNPAEQEPAGLAKDLTFQLPAGLIGNPTPFPQCPNAQFTKQEPTTIHNECAADTAIGVATITFDAPDGGGFDTKTVPLFNLPPQRGEPARFGFEVAGNATAVYLDTSVRTGRDYGVTVKVENIPEFVGFLASKTTFWGVPGNPIHDAERGWACLQDLGTCNHQDETDPPPFLSLPTSCSGPMSTSVQAASWLEPKPLHGEEAPLLREYEIGGLDGCNHLRFEPEISVAPDVPNASEATGLDVKVRVPQTAALNAEGYADSALRDSTVTLPAGVGINPGGADGLQACSEGLIGYEGGVGKPESQLFSPVLPVPLQPGLNFCPNGAKIATVKVKTPLLPEPLEGAMYLAEQNENPFGSLVAMYLVAEDPVAGVLAKIAGQVSLCEAQGQVIEGVSCEAAGQIVTTFKNTPQVPLEEIELHFFGESRAPLGTPALCRRPGEPGYMTVASFTPWSGEAPVQATSEFDITSGPDTIADPDGSPCPNPPGDQSLTSLPFKPELTAGTTSIQAGGFSPFTMTMSREDGEQNLKGISLHMPPGLSGALTGVTLCGEAQADAGTCGPESEIGETIVSVGLGGNPYTVTGGKVYLTGPYKGAPFGLSIVNPANAGPFHLGNVIVRAKIEVNPTTAALTVTSDTSGAYAIPPMIDGIPLQIKHINVTINRPGFTFNPTNCDPMAITGTLTSIEGATSALSVPFQATNCATLKFPPKFAVSTSGKTSRANGASLTVKLTYPKAPEGTQANIAKVKVDLPKQLPSRLTTLQKACTDAQFEANPAGCPVDSRVGQAKATTPILPVPLEGPAYFVSHGGAKFPELIIVLQGYGVTVDLNGETFISPAGITSSTFRTIPDVPVGSFELNLPEGPYSALAANGNLCESKLTMPTAFTAQNGAEIHETTKIVVTNCAKHKAKKAKAKHKKAKSKNS